MIAIAWYLLKVVLCSGILFGYYWIALRNKRFHLYNRFYLLIAVALSWIIPLLRIDFFFEEEQPQMIGLLTMVSSGNQYVEAISTQSRFAWDWNTMIMLAFTFVSAIFLTRLITGLINIKYLISKSEKQLLDDIYFVFSTAKGTPFSFFRYIFWNKNIELDSEDGQHILRHELAHVQEKHSADKLFIQLSLIVGWYNPFMWLVRRELNMIHEFIADEKAIKDGDTAAFARMILNAAYTPSFSFSNPFFYSPLKRRLLMLTSSKNARFTYLRRVAILPLLSFTSLLFAFNLKKEKSAAQADKITKSSLLRDLREASSSNEKQVSEKTGNQGFYDTIIKNHSSPNSSLDSVDKGLKKFKWPWRRVILNGERLSWEEFEARNIPKTDFITSTFIDKGNALDSRFADEAKEGLAIFTTKEIYEKTGVTTENGKKVIFTKDAYGNITTYGKEEAMVKFGFRASDINAWFAKEEATNNADTSNKIFTKVEHPATFKGSFSEYVKANLQYPSEAKSRQFQGKAIISFVVDEEGNLSDFKKISSLGFGLENEAIRLLKNSGKWNPAIQNGRKVVYQVKQEVDFKLNQQQDPGDTHAEFPGGAQSWKKYLERNLKAGVLAEKGAPAGNYTVVVKFNVSKTGLISKVVGETKNGFGAEKEAIRIVKTGPKWHPAVKNGRNVDSQVTQAITFQVAEE